MVCFSVICTVPWFQLPVYEPGVFWATWLRVLIIKVLAPDSTGDLAPLVSTLPIETSKSLHLPVTQFKPVLVTQSTWDTGCNPMETHWGHSFRNIPLHMQQGPDFL